MKLAFLFLIFPALLLPTLCFGNEFIVCTGFVDVPKFKQKTEVTIYFKDLEKQTWISLAAPITSDLEPEVGFKIISSKVIDNQTQVYAHYYGLKGRVSFTYIEESATNRYITNFKGSEQNTFFGPAKLLCN